MKEVKNLNEILEEIFEKEKVSGISANNYAEKVLYGNNSIDFNSQRYFEQILINFSKKKEIIIPKISEDRKNKYLYFDINRDWKSVWDIIFLGQIIKDEIIENFNNDVDIEKIADKEVVINNLPDGIKIEQIKELKQSIRWIQKIKDSIGHKDGKNICEKIFIDGKQYVNIENLGGKIPFKGKILLNYLEGFVNNRIIPLKQDKEIANKADNIAYPLLETLGYNPREIQNFFYRTNPALLSYILENVHGNNDILYKLPIKLYSLKANDLYRILNHNKVKSIESLIGLPDEAFESIDNLFQILTMVDKVEDLHRIWPNVFTGLELGMTELILNHPKVRGIKSLVGLSSEVFDEVLFTLLDHPKVHSIESLTVLPSYAYTFPNHEKLLRLLEHHKVKQIEDLRWLTNYAFLNIDRTEEVLNETENLEDLKCFSDIEYLYPKQLKQLINHPKVKGLESLQFVSEEIFENNVDDILKVLNHPKVNNLESLKGIQPVIFKNSKIFLKILSNPKIERIEDLIGISAPWFYVKELRNLLLNNLDYIEEFKYIRALGSENANSIEQLLQHPKVSSIKNLRDLPYDIIRYASKTIKVLDHPKVRSIESFKKFPLNVLIYDMDILELLEYQEIKDIGYLQGLPIEFFENYHYARKLFEKYGAFAIEIMKNIPIKLYYDIKNSSDNKTVINYNINLNNLDKLLRRVNNNVERLSEFPDEFFTCDSSLLDRMLGIYNKNLSKSIFGNCSPKTIILINYIHTVLTSNHFTKLSQEESKKYAVINLESFKNVSYGENNTLKSYLFSNISLNDKKYERVRKYLSNLENINSGENLEQISEKTSEVICALEQDLILEKGRQVSSVLGHLRNACSHFYFEEVTNKNIRIYDINEEGKITFDCIFPMEDLFKLVQKVENIDNIKINGSSLVSDLNLTEINELIQHSSNLKRNLIIKSLEYSKKNKSESEIKDHRYNKR